jgi:urease accessory protein
LVVGVTKAATESILSHWRASLAFEVESFVINGERRSRPSLRLHEGPLRLQKVLYPEGPELLHAIVLHPPGGVAGGDSLNISIGVAERGQLLCTTPGAGKWYRCEEHESQQITRLKVGEQSTLEWLPQENIVFDGAKARWTTEVDVAQDARVIGLEITMLGRQARSEQFTDGVLNNQLSIKRGGQLVFTEQWRLIGNDPRLNAQQGLAGNPCFGQLWAVAPSSNLKAAHLALNPEANPDDYETSTLVSVNHVLDGSQSPRVVCASTMLRESILIVRAQGSGPEIVRRELEHAWAKIRPAIVGRNAIAPRIWST